MLKTTEDILKIAPIGFKFKTKIISDSMFPTFKKKDLLIIKKTPFQYLKVGDIILSKQIKSQILVAHRIVKIVRHKSLIIYVKTKGDANETTDQEKIIEKKYFGKVIKIKVT